MSGLDIRKEQVNTAGGNYPVMSAAGLLDNIGDLLAEFSPKAGGYIVISDDTVAGLYLEQLSQALDGTGIQLASVIFPAGEPSKTLATISQIYDDLFAAIRPDRDCVILALGGGVVGDMAGFVAATMLRGVRFVQIPTTLLAAVDSSVGGKTGVDHASGKNLIGAFHQPCGVFMDTRTLRTLPVLEMSSGLAECVKHACIRRPEMLQWLCDNAAALLDCDLKLTAELIGWNVAIKAAIVSADERETGQRAHLNFGHTIGHAIEAVKGMDTDDISSGDYLRHGHCVALGMVAACRIAVSRGLLPAERADQLEQLLVKVDLPVRIELPVSGELLEIMRRDKKNRGGCIRFVLPDGDFGHVDLFADVSDDEITAALDYLRV